MPDFTALSAHHKGVFKFLGHVLPHWVLDFLNVTLSRVKVRIEFSRCFSAMLLSTVKIARLVSNLLSSRKSWREPWGSYNSLLLIVDLHFLNIMPEYLKDWHYIYLYLNVKDKKNTSAWRSTVNNGNAQLINRIHLKYILIFLWFLVIDCPRMRYSCNAYITWQRINWFQEYFKLNNGVLGSQRIRLVAASDWMVACLITYWIGY